MRKNKLTAAEAKRLAQFVKESGGGLKAYAILGVRPETISRTIHRTTAPDPRFRAKLAEVCVIDAAPLRTKARRALAAASPLA